MRRLSLALCALILLAFVLPGQAFFFHRRSSGGGGGSIALTNTPTSCFINTAGATSLSVSSCVTNCTSNCFVIVDLITYGTNTSAHACDIDGSTAINDVTANEDDTLTEVYRAGEKAVTGTHTFNCTWTGSSKAAMVVSVWENVNQTTPVVQNTCTDDGGTPNLLATLTLTGTTAGNVVTEITNRESATANTPTIGANQTQVINNVTQNAASNGRILGSYEAGGGNVTMSWSWTSSNRVWSMCAWELGQL